MLQVSPVAVSEKSLTNPLGLYIHIPFCEKKCNYCDFYSAVPDTELRKRYIIRLCEEIKKWGERTARPIDTLYIGGGTPSLLNESELNAIIKSVKDSFILLPDAEITCEVNPDDDTEEFLRFAKKLSVNRISLGVQSANDGELETLGRRHSFNDAVSAVKTAKDIGFTNISVDIMIGLPDSDEFSLQKSIDGILALETQHISAYILKIEDGTPFAKASLKLPDEDSVADQYLQMCKCFTAAGYEHYEISNFAKTGFQSRHNNRYWLDREYIGIGPAAHSYFEGKRFYYQKNISAFINGTEIVDDGYGGSKEEFIMLALRLSRGLIFKEYEDRFGEKISNELIKKARIFAKQGLCVCDSEHISLTDEGMLVSNSIIGELYENI